MGDDVDWDWVQDQIERFEQASETPAPPAPPSETTLPTEPPPVAIPPPAPAPDGEGRGRPGAPDAPEDPVDPRGDFAGMFSPDDYPAAALRNGDEGAVRARLTIGVEGRVLDCTVIRSSGHAALDDRTCVIFTERMRFEPARDAFGNAVEGSILTPAVSWQIPE